MTSIHQEHLRHFDMGAECDFCRARSFRRSRVQWKDLPSILMLRYPVRCLSCSQRQTVTVLVARRSLSSRTKQVRAAKDAAPWSGWGSTDSAPDQNGPLTVGGKNFSALPTHDPVAMPNLHGIVLEHATPTKAPNDPTLPN